MPIFPDWHLTTSGIAPKSSSYNGKIHPCFPIEGGAAMSKIKQAWTATEKLAQIDKYLSDERMSEAQRLGAIALLVHFHNTMTGECFPSLDQWAKSFGVWKSTAVRTAAKMEQLGYMTADHSDGGRNKRTSYHIKKTVAPVDRLGEETVAPVDRACRTSGPARVAPADPQVSRELNPENEASPATRKRVEASPKRNSNQGTGEENIVQKAEAERERHVQEKWEALKKETLTPEARAMFDRAGVKLAKPPPSAQRRWKATDADLRMFQHMSNGVELSERVNVTLGAPKFRNESKIFGGEQVRVGSCQATKDRKISRSNGREHSGLEESCGSDRSLRP
jgi:hypothetical protein